MTALDQFWAAVHGELLPRYLEENGYEPGGFRQDAKDIDESDAEWFLAAWRSGFVELLPKGEFWLPASRYRTMIFWEGAKATVPRVVTIYMEGLASIATAARLHFVFGWPKGCLGFESEGYAFDLIGRLPGKRHEYLAGEAKSSHRELERLLAGMRRCGVGDHKACHGKNRATKNAHKKWVGLARSKAAVLLTFGPGRDWQVFRVEHHPGRRFDLHAGSEDDLYYPGSTI